MNLYSLTLSELRKRLKSGEISPVELTKAMLERIEKTEPKIDAYLRKNAERALEEAEKADVQKPLGGIPIAIKDNICQSGEGCTCASKILQGFESSYDATVIRKLKEAGAVLLGRMNMDEFAMGSSTEHSCEKVTKNPWDPERIPGGSSGGSAAAVAGRSAIAALGSDTGGSIRQPASLCGCVGMKPTYGRVSRYGVVAFASSLDQIGPLTRTVEDNARVLQVIAGDDPKDNTTRVTNVPDYLSGLNQPLKDLKIGVPKEYKVSGLAKDVQDCIDQALKWYEEQGAHVVEVSLPHTEAALDVYYIIAPAEASANLARFDGVRYGFREKDAKDVMDCYKKTRAKGFGSEVKRRIILGTYVLSSGYYDAYYNRAQKVRHLIREDFKNALKECDVIATPTSPTTAFKIGEKMSDPLQMYLSDIYTIAVNLGEVCGMSLPCGFTPEGLPVGVQLIGSHFDETTLYRVGYQYEQAHEWWKKEPSL